MLYSELPSDYKKTINRNIFLFKCIGINFFDESKRFSLTKNIKLILFNLFLLPFVLSQFALIFEIRADNFLETVRVVPVALVFFLDIVMMTTAVLRRSEIRNLILEIGELWPRGLPARHEKSIILKAWLRTIKIPVDLFFIFAIANLSLFEVIPFVMSCYNLCNGVEVYLLPFQPPAFWHIDSFCSYFLTYLWEMASTFPCQSCLYLPYDLTIVIMTSNVSALFRLLQVDLKDAITIRDQDRRLTRTNDNVSNGVSYENVKKIVQTHQKLLRIAEQLSGIFGLVIFIHVAFAAVCICFFGFLTVVYGGLAETFANLLTVLNQMFTVFLLSLSGQFLCETSAQVADAAYQSNWYTSDVKVKKLILFIIIRAQNPSYLSALGFSNVTLRSFSKIMSSAWTYFSLLIQMYELHN